MSINEQKEGGEEASVPGNGIHNIPKTRGC